MSNETDLDWLARNVHVWPAGDHQSWCYVYMTYGGVMKAAGNFLDAVANPTMITIEQWLARRAELQNKPSWANHQWPQIFQNEDGHWFGARAGWDFKAHIGGGWKGEGVSLLRDDGEYLQSGEALGDWRDTLERRPVDLSEPAGGVKERGADGVEEINAMAQRLLVALKSDPRSFDTGDLAEMVELADAEIVKRDAKVCGDEGYLNNHWFERGELPPVGVECEFHGGARVGREWPDSLKDGAKVKVLCHYTPCMRPVAVFSFDIPGGKLTSQASEACFRPIRTERDELVNVFINHYGNPKGAEGYIGIAEAILAAGFSLGAK